MLTPELISLITRLAHRYTIPAHSPITHDDLIQEGYLAALEGRNIRKAIGKAFYQHRPVMEFPAKHKLEDIPIAVPPTEIV